MIAIFAHTPVLVIAGATISALGGLWANYSQNRDAATLSDKNEEIARLSQHIANAVTGGPTVCYLIPYGWVGPGSILCTHGDYPLYDVSIRVTDLQIFTRLAATPEGRLLLRQADAFVYKIPELPPKCSTTLPFTFDLHGDTRTWNIFFIARNGPFMQKLRMKLVAGKWEYANQVLRENGRDVACEQISPSYPRNPDSSISWD